MKLYPILVGRTKVPFGHFYGGLEGWESLGALFRFITDKKHFIWVPIHASFVAALFAGVQDLPAQIAQPNAASVPPSSTRQELHGHVPAAGARLTSIGHLPGSTRLHLAISLPLRNQQALSNLIQQLYDPTSPQYRRFLTLEQFTDGFGPTEADYEGVIDFATTNGLTVTAKYTSRVLLDVEAPAQDIEKALHISFRLYQHPTERREFFAPDSEPSLDLGIPLLHISGLHNYSLPRPASLHRQPLDPVTPIAPNKGSGTNGTYLGKDFRNAYVPGVPLAGAGQTVGLLEFDGYYSDDIAQYAKLAGIFLPGNMLRNIYIDGFSGTPGPANAEVALDIEMVLAMSPEVSQIIVYEAPDSGPWVDLLGRMAQDTFVKQFSSSWSGGTPDPAVDLILQQMAAQGQSFFQASGDSDAYTGDIPFPIDSPFATSVGGTTLTTTNNGTYLSETVWNVAGGIGSSGGVSTFYTIPAWQEGLNMTTNQGSTTFRNMPDVALTADNILVIADNGQTEDLGGTSAAAPLWAAFTALVNEQVSSLVCGSVGFVNPAIYAIGKGINCTNLMNDITNGNNFSPGSPAKFSATPGYDLCTGWGTPTANLINSLAGGSGLVAITIDPPSGSSLITTDAQPISVTVNGATCASVVASISGTTNLSLTSSNSIIYSGVFKVPARPALFALTVNATYSGRGLASGTGSASATAYYIATDPPLNDNFLNATKVPSAGTAYIANNRYATIEPGEPLRDIDPSVAGSLWWAWTPSADSKVLIDTSGSSVKTVLAVYTGNSITNLQPVGTTLGGVLSPSHLTFDALAGQKYNIALASAYINNLGSLHLSVIPNGQTDTSPPFLAVTSPPSGLSVSTNLITVSGTAIDAAPNDTGVNKVVLTVNGCNTGPASGTTNWTSTVLLEPGLNIIQVIAYDEAGNASSPVTIDLVYFAGNVANDFFVNALPLTDSNGTKYIDTSNATKEAGEPNHAGNAGGKSIWFTFTAPTDGVLNLSTEGSDFDTLLAMYTGRMVSNLTPVASNDDAFPSAPGGFSLLNQAVHSNITYSIAVDGYNGASGSNVLGYSFVPAKLVQLETAIVGLGSVQVATINQMGGRSIQAGPTVDVATNTMLLLTPAPSPDYQFDSWSGSVVSILAPLSLVINNDSTILAHFLPTFFSDDFESGTLTHLGWVTSGNQPWVIESTNVAAGHYAARSGAIGNNQRSSLSLTTDFLEGLGSFDYRVSSESGFDFLQFFIDGRLVHQWSGEAGWTTFTFPVSAGYHTLEWTYAKDPGGSAGFDAAFIDNVSLPILVPKNSFTPARLQLVNATDGTLFINVLGQSNQQYILQTSTDLKHWQNISSGSADYGYLRIDTGPTTNTTRFYRAVSP
jgi:hypothetical protein